MQRIFLVSISVFFLGLVGMGIWLSGSPSEARSKRFDEVRSQNLDAISNAVINYYNDTDKLPVTVAELDAHNQRKYNQVLNLVDPQSGVAYEYRVVSSTTREYELCAVFNEENQLDGQMNPVGRKNYVWQHSAGRDCFVHTAIKYKY